MKQKDKVKYNRNKYMAFQASYTVIRTEQKMSETLMN
jgi:hypothetical protein